MNLPPELEAALLGNSMVYVRGRLDEDLANSVIPQLLVAARTANPARGLDLFIDSPGGSLGAALSIYDVMQSLAVIVATTCIGTAGGAAVLLLAAGTDGQRYALPHARVHLMDETTTVEVHRVTDLASHAQALRDQNARWRIALAKQVRLAPERLVAELSAPRWLTAQQAKELGIIDAIVARRAAQA